MSWNYRLIRHQKTHKRMGTHEWYAVHEVYYREDGSIKAISEEPSPIIGDSVKDANGTRVLMFGAFKAAPLDMDEVRKEWRKERRSTLRRRRDTQKASER